MRSWDLLICGSGFGTTPYDVAHNVFMTLSPDTRTGEDDVQLVVEVAMRPSPQQMDFRPYHRWGDLRARFDTLWHARRIATFIFVYVKFYKEFAIASMTF